MKANLKETIRNEYVHGWYLNEAGQRIMPTIDDLIKKYNVPANEISEARVMLTLFGGEAVFGSLDDVDN